jgi:hypothetical protein
VFYQIGPKRRKFHNEGPIWLVTQKGGGFIFCLTCNFSVVVLVVVVVVLFFYLSFKIGQKRVSREKLKYKMLLENKIIFTKKLETILIRRTFL